MKKTLFAVMTIAVAMLAPTAAFAAQNTADAATVKAEPAVTATTTQVKDPNKVMVTINGVEMTQAQARVVILQNVKNHKQMTPEEMVAYINNLEANANNKK